MLESYFGVVESGDCRPRIPAQRIARDMREREGAEHLSMKNDVWACRRGLPVPAPIAIGGGTGGLQAPRQGSVQLFNRLRTASAASAAVEKAAWRL